jgi:hypothetical protein
MNKLPKNTPFFDRRRSTLIIMLVLSLIMLAIFARVYWIYEFAPVSNYWNTLAQDFLTVLVALAAAITGTLLLRKFELGEKPRQIWFWFILGWWSWVLGELSGAGYDIFKIPYGDLSVFDIFWTLGYLCFGLALYYQFRHIYRLHTKFKPTNYLLMVVFTFLVTFGLTQLALYLGLGQDQSWFSVYLAIFYPVCDFIIGLAALWLSLLFGKGSWGRPWWALIVFAVADAVNIFLWIGGDKLLAANSASLLDWISSVIYIVGYQVAMFGFVFILLHYLNIPDPKNPGTPQPPA